MKKTKVYGHSPDVLIYIKILIHNRMASLQLPVEYPQLPVLGDWLDWDPHMAYRWHY